MSSTSFSSLQNLVRIIESSCICKSFINIDDDTLFNSPLSYELNIAKFKWSFEGAKQLISLEEDVILIPKRAILHSYIYRGQDNPTAIEDKWYAITLLPDCPVSLEYLSTELLYHEVCVDTRHKRWEDIQPFPAELQIYIPSSRQEEDTRMIELRSKIEAMYINTNNIIQRVKDLQIEINEIIIHNRQELDPDFLESLQDLAHTLRRASNHISPARSDDDRAWYRHLFVGDVITDFNALCLVFREEYKELSDTCYSPVNKTITSIYNKAEEMLNKYANYLGGYRR